MNDDATILYRASTYDCEPCALKAQCCPNAPARKIPRSIHEGARQMARDICNSDEGRTSRRERKKIEMLFAHSNESSSLTGSGSEDPTVPETSSTSPPPPRTSASSPS